MRVLGLHGWILEVTRVTVALRVRRVLRAPHAEVIKLCRNFRAHLPGHAGRQASALERAGVNWGVIGMPGLVSKCPDR